MVSGHGRPDHGGGYAGNRGLALPARRRYVPWPRHCVGGLAKNVATGRTIYLRAGESPRDVPPLTGLNPARSHRRMAHAMGNTSVTPFGAAESAAPSRPLKRVAAAPRGDGPSRSVCGDGAGRSV